MQLNFSTPCQPYLQVATSLVEMRILPFQVCDTKADCKYKEDERYCVNLINSPSVYVRRDGRPVSSKSGLVAVNEKGHWFPACTETWNDDLNDKICRYMGRTKSESHTLISKHKFPSFINKKLALRYFNGHPVYPRTKRDTDEDEVDLVTSEPFRMKRQSSKRKAGFGKGECSFVQVSSQ